MKYQLLLTTAMLVASQSIVADVKPQDEHDAIEPDITIIESESKTIHVHKVNGQIYGIKVVPKGGPPYFLVDAAGDGNFVRSESHQILIPQWVLLKWK